MAILIHPDGKVVAVLPRDGEGHAFRPGEINELIDAPMGYLEGIPFPGPDGETLYMMLHEEGKLQEPPLPRNDKATHLLIAAIGLPPWDWVVGKALVVSVIEGGGNDADTDEDEETGEAEGAVN